MTTFSLKESLRGLNTPPPLSAVLLAALDDLNKFWGVRIQDHLEENFISLLGLGCIDQANGQLDTDLFKAVIEANASVTKAFDQAKPF
jgi:hypothetical protein